MTDEVNVTTTPEEPTKANILVRLTRDNQECEMMLQRTGANTENPTPEELAAALAEAGVVYGIKTDLLADLASAPVYNKNFVVAAGQRPTVGGDGEIRYLIKTERALRPTIREDGTADYKDLGYVNNVEAGQALCDIIPPQQGQAGTDVLGNVLEGIFGKEPPSPQGANTQVSEDGSQLLASTAGNAVVSKGAVSVQEILKIQGNVDNSTGDISFVGDVQIKGFVASGFRVRGTNITVKGYVEGAHLEADGDIVIAEGMNGMNRGTVTAKGNIKAKFLQNCVIKAEGNIYADTIMYSNLECDGDVELGGKRSALIGGRSFIAGKLTAKTLGTDAHTATQINMATTGMAAKREVEELTGEINATDGDIAKLVQLLNRFEELKKQNRLTQEHAATILQVKQNYMLLQNKRQTAVQNLEQMRQRQLEQSRVRSYIECKDRIHEGVRITFGPLVYNVQDSFVNSRLGIAEGEILISSLR